eukprot:6190649-Pleurochrysis_carterae.AAC.4
MEFPRRAWLSTLRCSGRWHATGCVRGPVGPDQQPPHQLGRRGQQRQDVQHRRLSGERARLAYEPVQLRAGHTKFVNRVPLLTPPTSRYSLHVQVATHS